MDTRNELGSPLSNDHLKKFLLFSYPGKKQKWCQRYCGPGRKPHLPLAWLAVCSNSLRGKKTVGKNHLIFFEEEAARKEVY
jgi:hypothetical protein